MTSSIGTVRSRVWPLTNMWCCDIGWNWSRGTLPLTPSILRLAAVRQLAYETADTGILSPELAAGIQRERGQAACGSVWQLAHRGTVPRSAGRAGHFYPNRYRDRAMLSLPFGCRLRRAELVALELRNLQRRENHWVLVDLIGKGKHIRTVPVPDWVQAAVAAWTTVARITEGRLSRCAGRYGRIWGSGITDKVVWRVEEVRQCDRDAETGPARLPPHVRSSLSRSRRRVGADSVSVRPRVRRDHRAVPGLDTARP
jgi:integrase